MKFDDLGKLLEQIQETTDSLSGTYNLSEILTDDFISNNTSFANYEEFIENAPVKITEDMDETTILQIDDYVASNTNFSDWQEILDVAGKEFAVTKLKQAGF